MLNAGMRESSEREITLYDTPLQAFKILLKYIYVGRIKLAVLNYMELIDLLGLVNKYSFIELEIPIIDYLKVFFIIFSVINSYLLLRIITLAEINNIFFGLTFIKF